MQGSAVQCRAVQCSEVQCKAGQSRTATLMELETGWGGTKRLFLLLPAAPKPRPDM